MVHLNEVADLCKVMTPPEQVLNLTNLKHKTLYISSYHFAINVYTVDRKHPLDVLFGGDYQQLASRIRRSLKVLKKYKITPVFYQEAFSSEKSVEADSERRSKTYERGQDMIPANRTNQAVEHSRRSNWHSNVSWLSFCMYQIFKEENILLLEHETMANICEKASGDNNAIVVTNNPDHILRFDICKVYLRDFAFILSRKATESSSISDEEVAKRTFEVKVFSFTPLTRRKLMILYEIGGKIDNEKSNEKSKIKIKHENQQDFHILVEKMNSVDISVENNGDNDNSDLRYNTEKPERDMKTLTSEQQIVIDYLKSHARLSHQLEAVVKGEPAIMSSIIDNINGPSAWNAALPIFQAIWSMLVYECKLSSSSSENSEKQFVNVLDRVDGSSTYALKQIKLKKCEGLGSFLEYPKLENRSLVYNILGIDSERAESVFDSGKAILKNENNNEVFLSTKFEIILLALIFWFRKLSESQMRVFEDELSIVVESIVFMAVSDTKKIDIFNKKGKNEAKTRQLTRQTTRPKTPVISKDNKSSMFIMHAIAEIRCILVALNQLNKTTDDPFKKFDVELWKGNALEKILRYRLENDDLEVLFEGDESVCFQDQFGACLMAIEYCLVDE